MNSKDRIALGKRYIEACSETANAFSIYCDSIDHEMDKQWRKDHLISQKCKVESCKSKIEAICHLCKDKTNTMGNQALQKHLGTVHYQEVLKFLQLLDDSDENAPVMQNPVPLGCPSDYKFVSEAFDEDFLRSITHLLVQNYDYTEDATSYKVSINGIETLLGERMGELKGIYKLLAVCDRRALQFGHCIVPVRGFTMINNEMVVLLSKMPDTCNQKTFRTQEVAVRVARAMFRALSFFHNHDFIHNGIRPANIFCITDEITIGGFGSSMHVSSVSRLKPSYSYYTPPEQAPSFAADLWSCGVTLLELSLGKSLDEAFGTSDIADRLVHLDGNDVPTSYPNLFALIKQLLSIDPDERGSAKELLENDPFLNSVVYM